MTWHLTTWHDIVRQLRHYKTCHASVLQPGDYQLLASELPRVVTSLTVDWEDWNHMDFQTAIDAPRWLLLLFSETLSLPCTGYFMTLCWMRWKDMLRLLNEPWTMTMMQHFYLIMNVFVLFQKYLDICLLFFIFGRLLIYFFWILNYNSSLHWCYDNVSNTWHNVLPLTMVITLTVYRTSSFSPVNVAFFSAHLSPEWVKIFTIKCKIFTPEKMRRWKDIWSLDGCNSWKY